MTYEELEETVRQLREDLHGAIEAVVTTRLMTRFGLTPLETRALQVLHHGGGELVRRRTLYAALWPQDTVDDKILDVVMCKLRRKGFAIRNVWGAGYVLDKPGMAKVNEALVNEGGPNLLGYLATPRDSQEVAAYLGCSKIAAAATLRGLRAAGVVTMRPGRSWLATAP